MQKTNLSKMHGCKILQIIKFNEILIIKHSALFFFTLLVIGNSLCYADIPITYVVNSELELSNGTKISGFLESGGYGGCKYSKKEKQWKIFVFESDSGKEVSLTDEYFFKHFIQNKNELFSIYRKIYNLSYLPKSRNKIISEASAQDFMRTSFTGVLDSEEVKINPLLVKSARVLKCKELNVAPVVILNKEELDLLMKPSNAFFSVEHYPDGNVSLISYNSQWDTPDKLQTLLKEFIAKQKPVKRPEDYDEDPYYWYPIYVYEDEFRQQFLPKKIVLLIYHVTD